MALSFPDALKSIGCGLVYDFKFNFVIICSGCVYVFGACETFIDVFFFHLRRPASKQIST